MHDLQVWLWIDSCLPSGESIHIRREECGCYGLKGGICLMWRKLLPCPLTHVIDHQYHACVCNNKNLVSMCYTNTPEAQLFMQWWRHNCQEIPVLCCGIQHIDSAFCIIIVQRFYHHYHVAPTQKGCLVCTTVRKLRADFNPHASLHIICYQCIMWHLCACLLGCAVK